MTDYDELVQALRILQDKNSLSYYKRKVCKDAADAIEALQAEIRESMQRCAECGDELAHQMPKRGEWELIDGAEPMRWGCSRCKYMSWETSNYCPRCGADMRAKMDGPIITPCRGCSDYDGYGGCKSKGGCARAKMEVQE